MSDGDFDDFESLDDESVNNDRPIVNERQEKSKRSDKRRRLEDLLEEKRLRAELDGYDEHFSRKRSYYSDDIFDD